MARYFVTAFPLALFWMGITNVITLESFLFGYGLTLGGLILLRPRWGIINWQKLPGQLVALVIYVVILYRDILLSGIDVARRVLAKDMRLKTGIIAVPVQDPEKNPVIAALSSDVVTLTPGELVVELEDNSVMYVHCLDVEEAASHAADVQAKRVQLLQRVLGR